MRTYLIKPVSHRAHNPDKDVRGQETTNEQLEKTQPLSHRVATLGGTPRG